MEKIDTKMAFIIAGVLLAAFIAYQAFVVVPKNRIEAQETQFLFKITKYEECKANAVNGYDVAWDSTCEIQGIDTKGPNCLLPRLEADRITERTTKAVDRCVTLYK